MQPDNPVISVVMSVYNGEKYLAEAIESILNQTFSDFEFIIVDDGSTDSSLSIIQIYMKQDDRIVLISRDNRGLPYSLNEAISISNGVYIARMDADDISLPHRFKTQIEYMKKEAIDVLFSKAILIDESSNQICKIFTPLSETCRKLINHKNYYIHPSVMIKKTVFSDFGFYDESFKSGQDWDLWKRIAGKVKVNIIPDYLFLYRFNFDSITMKRLGKKRNHLYFELAKACLRNFDDSNIKKYENELAFFDYMKVKLARLFFMYRVRYFYLLLSKG